MTETLELEQAKAEVERLERELSDAKARVRELRPVKAKAEPKPCACCGELTGGGDFLPGHDAKLRSRLLKAVDAGDESAVVELLARPTLLHGASETELRERLGSETRKKEAQVEREAERQAAKAAKSSKTTTQVKVAKPRVDPVEAQQGTKSPTATRNGAATRLARQRAVA